MAQSGSETVAEVGFPTAVPGIFDYRVGEQHEGRVGPGTAVLVELRTRRMWGVVVRLKSGSPFPNLKEVLDVSRTQWTSSSETLIELYKWIAGYYQCDLAKVFKPFVRKRLLETGAKTRAVYTLIEPPRGLTRRQLDAVERLRALGCASFTAAQALDACGLSGGQLARLCAARILTRRAEPVVRDGGEPFLTSATPAITLTPEQAAAVITMADDLSAPTRPYLLHGITGSGKTFVYIELAKKTLRAGKGVIILVPEISLTPQTIHRFRSAVGDEVAVIHSRMSEGERRDSLQELITGAKRLVVGARSAILAPMEACGLIVVDEEHDGSYKQTEQEPRYHARDVAVMRGSLQKALVVLGSATPSLESYYNARTGKYHLLTLTNRFGPARLPAVEIADMNREHRENNWTFMSRALEGRIGETLRQERQVILLLNRRGFSVSLICRNCGYVHVCPHCSVTLTYHRAGALLRCHQCGRDEPAPATCPKCRGEQMKYQGTGIQKAEEYLRERFPDARVIRMDRDTTRRKGSHASILDCFAGKGADILLGTQMVAKGLDFPGVALVGVLQGDIGLHLPDFRASERTFQLLSQVAGRAGRTDACGEVIIQTYLPTEHAVTDAQTHDYASFYEKEIEARKALDYPPFTRLVRIVLEGPVEEPVRRQLSEVARSVGAEAGERVTVLGPAPAALRRLKDNFRYSLILKSRHNVKMQAAVREIRRRLGRLPAGMRLTVDVDPTSML